MRLYKVNHIKDHKNKTLDEIYDYWNNPDEHNHYTRYLPNEVTNKRSRLLLDVFGRYVNKDYSILELGCNVGRNLNFLYKNGYSKSSGIEINSDAYEHIYTTFPEMAKHSKFFHSTIEDIIKTFDNKQFDVVYAIAVLEHIHIDSEWTFEEIKRITNKYIILIEDETGTSSRHFPRDYKKIFTEMGCKQIYKKQCNIENGLNEHFTVRVFEV